MLSKWQAFSDLNFFKTNILCVLALLKAPSSYRWYDAKMSLKWLASLLCHACFLPYMKIYNLRRPFLKDFLPVLKQMWYAQILHHKWDLPVLKTLHAFL
jgi:hypothetical protein